MTTPTPGRYRDALRARDLRLLLTAFGADSLGGWAYNVVLVVHLYDRTGSTAVIAATSACSWVPRLALSAYAGVLADRYERRTVMLGSAASCGALALGLSAGVAADAPVWVLLALHALLSACAAFYEPAAQALVPAVVAEKDLVAANGLFGVVDNLAVVAGPALGGLFLLTGRPALGLLFNAGTFAVALLAVRALRVRSATDTDRDEQGPLAQIGAGVTALRREPVAAVLVLLAGLSTATYGALSLLQVPLSQRFGTGSAGYSYLVAATAVGGLVGASLVNRLAASARLAPAIVGGMLVLTLPLAVSATVTAPLAGAALQALAGGGMVVVDVLAVTALQRDLPRGVLSRVLGLVESLGLAGALAASVGASLLLRATSLETALLVLGLGGAGLALLAARPLAAADRTCAQAAEALRPRTALLQELDLLDGAEVRTVERLAAALQRQEVPAGTPVVREGDPADALYVVAEGELAVGVRGGGPLPALRAGDCFGEIALLHPGPRTATVVARTAAVLWRLDAEDFAAAVEDAAPGAGLLRLSAARLARSHPLVVHRPRA